MKKIVFVFVFILANFTAFYAQSAKGARIGYIDMEYILQNIPEYAEANNQLELKAQSWKLELDTKQNEIFRLKEILKTEKVLLTKELIEEREEAIAFLEKDYSDYQQKKFGPTGDLMVQKQVLVKPIQDQVFTAVRELAEANKYDFILDKSSDLTLMFADKKWNLSPNVIRKMTRSSRISKMSKKDIKAEDAKDAQEDLESANPDVAVKKKTQADRKAALELKREETIAARAAAREEADLKRKNAIAEKLAARVTTIAAKRDSIKSQNVAGKSNLAEDRSKNLARKDSLRNQNIDAIKKANEQRAATAAARLSKNAASISAKRDSINAQKTSGKSNVVEERTKALAKNVAQRDSIRKLTVESNRKAFEDRKIANEKQKAKVLAKRDSTMLANAKKKIIKKE